MPHSAFSAASFARGSRTFLQGFGQIMLQESAATGFLFLLGIFANSPLMAVGAMIGAASGWLCAGILGCEPSDTSRGWYGYNGALVGIALLFFHEPHVPLFLLIIAGGALSTVLMRMMLVFADRVPPYTAPFILATWLLLPVAEVTQMAENPSLPPTADGGTFIAVMHGIGQVMFQEYWVSGILFFIGLLVFSPNAAAWALMGSALGVTAAHIMGYPEDLILAGSYGFNASLSGIAIAGKFRTGGLAALAAITLSVILTRGFQLASLPALTAPFVLATWAVIALAWLIDRRSDPA